MERPRSITVVAATLAGLIAVALTLGLITGPAPEAFGTRVFFALNALVGWAVLYFFWRGRNWARIIIMIQSVFTILNALMATRISHQAYLFLIAMTAVSILLLFYLTRPAIRAWFRAQSESARSGPGKITA